MIFSVEDYSPEILAEMRPLWEAHYQEIAAFKDIPLDPDLQSYAAIAANGMLRIFTVRDEDGKLCGYQVMFVKKNPHYQTSLQAVQDILFLSPDKRNGLVGYRFIEWCDKKLAAEGVEVVYQHVKSAHDFSGLLERIGYKLHDKVMARRLK